MQLNDHFKDHGIKTSRFTLCGQKMYGRLVDIIDGDSLSIVLYIYDQYYKFNTRLNGIDTSEIHSKNDQLKQIALNTRNELLKLMTGLEIDKILTKHEMQIILEENIIIVWVECLDFDKYGRLLAEVYCYNERDNQYNINLSKYLLDHHLAYEYNGGSKLEEHDQLHILE